MKLFLSFLVFMPVVSFAAVDFAVDTAYSKVEWRGSKVVGGEHFGTISLTGGQVKFEAGKPVSGEFTLDMTSINNVDLAQKEGMKKKLEGHLKSNDFFAVEANPTSKFVIKSVKALGGEKYAFTGDLEIRGVTKAQVIEATVSLDGKIATATGEVSINRTEFGVMYSSTKSRGWFSKMLGSGKDKIISDDLNIKLNIIAKAE